MAFALCTGGCADLWGFSDVIAGDAGDGSDATTLNGDGSGAADGSMADAAGGDAPLCPPYMVPCGDGGCVAASTAANCGACGNQCSGATPVCTASAGGTFTCVACPPSAATACNHSCINTMTDPSHCASCGNACSTDAGNSSAACIGGACTFTCSGGFNLCNGACVDYANAANCGQCGHACTGGSVCASNGGTYSCQSGCPTNTMNCAGSCADLTSTTTNCGACGHVCPSTDPNAQPACVNGACTVSCNAGYTLCNGLCVEFTTTANCGGCGQACGADAGGAVCSPSSAGAYSCGSVCPASAPSLCGGTCVDTARDLHNCQTCGNACSTSVANAQPTCVNGVCGISCISPYTLCNGSCVDRTSDRNNCGTCGQACSAEAGTPVCSGSMCLSGCPSSAPDLCNGTCVDTATNANDCGTCGRVCSTGVANALATCVGGTCGFACKAGYTECNGACVNEQTDTANCGGCGSAHACVGGQICQSGACKCSAPACAACTLGVPCCKSSNTCGCSTLGLLGCN